MLGPDTLQCVDQWWWEVIGWTGSAVLVISLLQTQLLRLRLINLVGCVILLGYNAVVGVWPMVGLNAVLALINVVYLWRMMRTRHDAASFTVLPVGPADAYLRHILTLFGSDIARFNPDFRYDPQDGHAAFLVQQGAETVGVVLVEDAGDGVAQVVLDWVTPRHRDLSPGEFVYGSSGLFTERGFRTVLSPPGMVQPHFERLGFHRSGDRWQLNLT